ncbi:MAG: hypothetical protein N2690_08850, partial [Rhodocyclaceae bacterium]|nr:hypothetical protein [Rhodocyclaceae bacterium]
MSEEISDEILGAFLDDELDATERARLLARMATDAELGTRACELWKLKQMLRGAYPASAPKSALAGRRPLSARWTDALAAAALLAIGSLTGWFVNEG